MRFVLTTGKAGREGHRHWSDEVKARIVSEFAADVTVNEVAKLFMEETRAPVLDPGSPQNQDRVLLGAVA